MNHPSTFRWFDAHLDLAYLAVCGRDMTRPLADLPGDAPPHPPCAVTLPDLVHAGVGAMLATIFTESHPPGAAAQFDGVSYHAGDTHAAHARGIAQLRRYHLWHDQGLIALQRATHLAPPDVPRPHHPKAPPDPPAAIILMEGADPIRRPDELQWWAHRGVGVVGLTWARGSVYAAGNSPQSSHRDVGLTPQGRNLVAEIDRLGLIHDASHLSRVALDKVLEIARGTIIASHSNAQALHVADDDRHLSDAHAREIARRGGVIGLNLYAPFVDPQRPTIDRAVDHVEHWCSLLGSRDHVGLGSDIDGGFSGDKLPSPMRSIRDLGMVAEALAKRGWADGDIHAFSWGNWARVLRARMPSTAV